MFLDKWPIKSSSLMTTTAVVDLGLTEPPLRFYVKSNTLIEQSDWDSFIEQSHQDTLLKYITLIDTLHTHCTSTLNSKILNKFIANEVKYSCYYYSFDSTCTICKFRGMKATPCGSLVWQINFWGISLYSMQADMMVWLSHFWIYALELTTIGNCNMIK